MLQSPFASSPLHKIDHLEPPCALVLETQASLRRGYSLADPLTWASSTSRSPWPRSTLSSTRAPDLALRRQLRIANSIQLSYLVNPVTCSYFGLWYFLRIILVIYVASYYLWYCSVFEPCQRRNRAICYSNLAYLLIISLLTFSSFHGFSINGRL